MRASLEDTNLLYHFIGEGAVFDHTKLQEICTGAGVRAERLDNVIEFLLYYGFLGVQNGAAAPTFVYDVNYDMKLLMVLAMKAKGNLSYVLNPAFHAGLNL